MNPGTEFSIVLRGYDRAQVDRAIAEAEAGRKPSDTSFWIALRGYDRAEVDAVMGPVWPTTRL